MVASFPLRHCSQTWLHIRIMPGALKKSFPTLQTLHLMAAMVEDNALGHMPRGRIPDSEDTGIFNFTDNWVFQSWSTWLYPSPTSSEKSSPTPHSQYVYIVTLLQLFTNLENTKWHCFLLLYSLLLVSSSLQQYYNLRLNYCGFIACYSSPTLFCLFLRLF